MSGMGYVRKGICPHTDFSKWRRGSPGIFSGWGFSGGFSANTFKFVLNLHLNDHSDVFWRKILRPHGTLTRVRSFA